MYNATMTGLPPYMVPKWLPEEGLLVAFVGSLIFFVLAILVLLTNHQPRSEFVDGIICISCMGTLGLLTPFWGYLSQSSYHNCLAIRASALTYIAVACVALLPLLLCSFLDIWIGALR